MSKANQIQHGGTHYGAEYQHWDLVCDLQLNYYAANSTKYITRHEHKNGLQDVQKAVHYLEKWIELITERRMPPPSMPAFGVTSAQTTMLNQFLQANGILEDQDRFFIAYVALARSSEDLVRAMQCAERIAARYPAQTPRPTTEDVDLFVKATKLTGISRHGFKPGQYVPSAQFTREGYRGNMDCWQCRKCRAHFELPFDSNPEALHVCDELGGEATPGYVDQDRQGQEAR